MLDEMAQNDPEAYKNFVAQNVQEGAKDLKQKVEEQRKQQKQEGAEGPAPVRFRGDEGGPDKQVEEGVAKVLGKSEAKQSKRVLVEELEPPRPQPKVGPPTVLASPEFTLEESEESYGFVVQLPLVERMADIDLQVSVQEMRLSVAQKYGLSVQLSSRVDCDQINAKWNRKNR